MKRLILLAALLAPLLPLEGAEKPFVRLFVLSGQSNMGRGAPVNSYSNPPQPGDIWYRFSIAPDPGSDEWMPLSAVLNRGAESAFGERMSLAFPGDQIALLKCYRAGSGITEWLPGRTFHATMVGRLQAVAADLEARVARGEISGWEYTGYLWMQGEGDAAAAASAIFGQMYLENLENLRDEMRTLLGGDPNLPFILGRIYAFHYHEGSPHSGPWENLANVRYAQEILPLIDPRCAWFDTDDLSMRKTEPHYVSYEEMGHRFAHAFLNLHHGHQLPFRPFRVHPTTLADEHLSTTPGNQQVTLDWNHALHAESYSIRFGTSPGSLDQSVEGIPDNQVTIRGLQNGVTYYFAGQSHNTEGMSPLTPEVAATPTDSSTRAPLVWIQDLKTTPDYSEVAHLGQPFFLDGTVRHHHPEASVTWSVLSGAGSVSFEDTRSIDTTARFDDLGRHYLQLTVDDGVWPVSHTLEVNVVPPPANSPPNVTTTWVPPLNLLDQANLTGHYRNLDRLPHLGVPTYAWSVASGPGPVTFSDPHYRKTTARFSEPGIYQLQFTGSDGEASAASLVTVAVNPLGVRNHALDKPATGSSQFNALTSPGNACNGKLDLSDFYGKFCSAEQPRPWLDIDLMDQRPVTQIRVWNARAFDGVANRLSQYHVFLSPEPFVSHDPAEVAAQVAANGGWHRFESTTAGFPTVLHLEASGRYLRLQLSGTSFLEVKELEALGPAGPDAPGNLTATATGHDSMLLGWSDVSGEQGYVLRRSTSEDGPWTEVGGTLPADTTAFHDSGLEELTTYYYQIQAFHAVASSEWSAAASARTHSALTVPQVNALQTPIGLVGRPYQHRLDIIGGTPPYSLQLSGQVPSGIAVDSQGVLGGTPASGGTFTVDLQITDADLRSSSTPLTILIATRNHALAAEGATASQSSTLSGLGAALAIDGNTDTLNHTQMEPTAWWQVDLGRLVTLFQIEVHNRAGATAQRLTDFYLLFSEDPFPEEPLSQLVNRPGVIAIHHPGQALFPTLIAPPPGTRARFLRVQLRGSDYLHIMEFRALGSPSPAIPEQALPEIPRTHPYTHALTGQAGHGALLWSLAPGSSLPTGLSLSPSGVLSGRPSQTGNHSFLIQVVDQAGVQAQRSLTLPVVPRPADLWLETHFPSIGGDPPPRWSAEAGASGQSLLLAYARGDSPHGSSSPSAPLSLTLHQESLVYQSVPLRDDPSLHYALEVSSDLKNWYRGPTVYTLQTAQASPGFIRFTATDSQPLHTPPQRFARLVITIEE